MKRILLTLAIGLCSLVAFANDDDHYVDGDFSFTDEVVYGKIEMLDSTITVEYETSDGTVHRSCFVRSKDNDKILVMATSFAILLQNDCCIEVETSKTIKEE